MKRILLVLLAFFFCNSAFSQASNAEIKQDSSYLFKFSDETSLMGKVISISDSIIKVETKSLGTVEIKKKNITTAEMLTSQNTILGKYWFKNPNATRYLFSPSAIPLERGEGYFQNSYLLVNSAYAGITNNISIGMGFEFISTFTGHPLFYGALKGSGKIVKNFYAGGGVIYASAPVFDFDDDNERTSFGAIFTTYTYGNLNNNISLNAGFGYAKEDGFSERPLFSISGMARISRKTFVITENWIMPIASDYGRKTYYALYTYGFRFSGERMSVDLALVNSKDISDAIVVGFPYVGFAVKF